MTIEFIAQQFDSAGGFTGNYQIIFRPNSNTTAVSGVSQWLAAGASSSQPSPITRGNAVRAAQAGSLRIYPRDQFNRTFATSIYSPDRFQFLLRFVPLAANATLFNELMSAACCVPFVVLYRCSWQVFAHEHPGLGCAGCAGVCGARGV